MKKPTIHELEKILDDPDERITIRPDGSVVTTKNKEAENAQPKILTLDEAIKKSSY